MCSDQQFVPLESFPAITISFYAGSYGPTLLLDVPSPGLLGHLYCVIRELQRKETDSIHIHSRINTNYKNISDLQLTLSKKKQKKTLHRHKDNNGNTSFVWTNNADDWTNNLEMLEGLIRSKAPRHQYFTLEDTDDALLVISYQENTAALR